MLRHTFLTVAVAGALAASASADISPGVIFHEDFADGNRIERDDPNMPNWYSVRDDLEIRGGQNRLDTWFDTGTHLIGATVSEPLPLSETFPLQLTLDYNARTDDNLRTSLVIFGLYAGEPISGDGFTPWNRDPETGDTADWEGYQIIQGVDGDETVTSGVFRSTPEGGLGSIHFHNNELIAETPAKLASVRGWDGDLEDFGVETARLVLYLNAEGHVVTEYWAGEDRDTLQLLATGVDDDPDRVIGGFQHIGLGARGHDGAHPRVLFDNMTVEYIPEPGSALLIGLGTTVLMLRRRRSR